MNKQSVSSNLKYISLALLFLVIFPSPVFAEERIGNLNGGFHPGHLDTCKGSPVRGPERTVCLTKPDGKTQETTPFTGLGVHYHSNGKIRFKKEIKNGKEKGKTTSWYYNRKGVQGIRSISYWKDNLQYGEFKKYYKNGKLEKEGTYANDERHGIFKDYNSKGELRQEVMYKNGKFVKNLTTDRKR